MTINGTYILQYVYIRILTEDNSNEKIRADE